MVAKSVATVEKSCALVALRSNASPGCYFRISPRFKLRLEGEPVSTGDHVCLVSPKAGVSLHVSDAQYSGSDTRHEVNGSLALTTGFKVSPYAEYNPALDDCLKGGDFMRVFHAESEAALTYENFDGSGDAVALRAAAGSLVTAHGNVDDCSNAVWEVELDGDRKGGACGRAAASHSLWRMADDGGALLYRAGDVADGGRLGHAAIGESSAAARCLGDVSVGTYG